MHKSLTAGIKNKHLSIIYSFIDIKEDDMDITIRLNDDELKVLKRRAKKDLLQLREEIEDIVRRSCINFKSKGNSTVDKCDDKLVGIFSRKRPGKMRKL